MIDYEREFIPYVPPEPIPPIEIDDDDISDSSVWSSEKSVSKFHPYVFQIQESGGHYYMKNEGLFTTLKTLVDKYSANNSTSVNILKTATMGMIFCFIGTKTGMFCTHCESGKVGSTNTLFMDFEYTTSSSGTITKHPVHLEIPENYVKGTTGTVIGDSISVTVTPDA